MLYAEKLRKSRPAALALGLALLLGGMLIISGAALAKKPPPDSGGPQDIPICVTVDDGEGTHIKSDGFGDYCDSKKDKVAAFVGRLAGQFVLDTNTNLAAGGSSMRFYFPAGTTTKVFGKIGVDEYPQGFVPTNVWVASAREQVGAGNGYIDLRTMEEDDVAPIAIRIQMELDGQNIVDLNYGDVLWAPGDPHSYVVDPLDKLATVVGGPDTDGDGYSDSWIISGTTAWMNEVINNQFTDRMQIGEVEMNFSFLAIEK